MTKRHFEAFANKLRIEMDAIAHTSPSSQLRRSTTDRVTFAAETFADVVQEENSRFDRDRFMQACGLR